jgi:hypothetical protein
MKNTLVLLVTVILSFGFLEVSVRLLNEEPIIVDADWFSKFFKKNSIGIRDIEYPLKKSENKFRILIVGDSQTAGHGIEKLEDTYPKKLEAYLNKGLKNPIFEVINYAMYAWNTDSQLYSLFQHGFKLQPDLILLAYYHNDMPPPFGHPCVKYEDGKKFNKNIIPLKNNVGSFLYTKSRFYRFINFRFIGLMEANDNYPTHIECMKMYYSNRSWDIEKIYLETILKSTKTQNIHFIFSIIPELINFESDYPLVKAHYQLTQFMEKKGVPVIDFYEESFKGLLTKDFYISKYDRHLNEYGAEIIAKTLYKHFEGLRSYKNLKKISGIFELNELLSKNSIARQLDKAITEIQKYSDKIKISGISEELNFQHIGDALISRRSQSIPEKNINKIVHLKTDQFGGFINRKKTIQNLTSGEVLQWDNIKLNNKKYVYESSKGDKVNYLFSLKKYTSANRVYRRLFIEEGIPFLDPKVFEPNIFRIAGLAPEVVMSNKFSFYLRYGWVDYLRSLFQELEEHRPSRGTQMVIDRIKPKLVLP